MAEVKLLVRVPMDCWRQWIRHRTASINETSTRYSIAIDAAQRTRARGLAIAGRRQPPRERGLARPDGRRRAFGDRSGGATTGPRGLPASAGRGRRPRTGPQGSAPLHLHRGLLEIRSAQPAALSANSRTSPAAQWEIRQYAETIAEQIVRPLFPLVWEAFVDYRLQAMRLSRLDREVIARLAAARPAAGGRSAVPGRRRSVLGRPDALPRARRMPREAGPVGPAVVGCSETHRE